MSNQFFSATSHLQYSLPKYLRMKNLLVTFCCLIIILSFKKADSELVAINATIPSVTTDAEGIIYIVFANGNKIEYVTSADKGVSFSKPVLVDTIKDLFGVAGRGPHIICASNTLTILAPDQAGNIHAYTKDANGKWMKNGLVNDVPEVCKEGFVSVSAKGDSLFAVWLDVRNTKRNKIVGALSADGGKTWSRNKIIYESPSGGVCECCKPSVAFGNNGINVMFRNNLDGNRNLYLIQSHDGGKTFGTAMKLGEGNWKLDGCPMDGGGITVNNGLIKTVWRRMDTIYSDIPGKHEEMIGKGKNCTIENTGNANAYAWLEGKNIVCLLPNKKKIVVGEGTFPVLQQLNAKQLICVWEKDKSVYSRTINL